MRQKTIDNKNSKWDHAFQMDFEIEEIFCKNKLSAVQHVLRHKDKDIGYINVDITNRLNFVTVANIQKSYRGKGYGKKMYEHALAYHGRLSSRYHSASSDAQYVWKSLIRKYKYTTDFFQNRVTIYKKPNS